MRRARDRTGCVRFARGGAACRYAHSTASHTRAQCPTRGSSHAHFYPLEHQPACAHHDRRRLAQNADYLALNGTYSASFIRWVCTLASRSPHVTATLTAIGGNCTIRGTTRRRHADSQFLMLQNPQCSPHQSRRLLRLYRRHRPHRLRRLRRHRARPLPRPRRLLRRRLPRRSI